MSFVYPSIKDIPIGPYNIIAEDPPYRFRNWSSSELATRGEKWGRAKGRSPYDCLDDQELYNLPIERLAAKDCARFTWITGPKLPTGIKMIEGRQYSSFTKTGPEPKPIFDYKSQVFTWIKLTPCAWDNFLKELKNFSFDLYTTAKNPYEGVGDFVDKEGGKLFSWFLANSLHFGGGFWTHANAEICVLSTRGKLIRQELDVPSTIFSMVNEHSAKPRAFYNRIDRLLGKELPRIELYARKTNPPPSHWDATGLEWDGKDIRNFLEEERFNKCL